MKVLITADIHIDDYANYNYTDKARLNLYLKLAERLVELSKQYQCEEIWILGDLINRPTSRGYVLHIASKFLNILSKNSKFIRLILGNHDSDSKSQSLGFETSQVTLLDYPNLEYMDKKLLEIDGHLFGWMNWYPDQDLSWLGDRHLDVLFGHYTKSDLFGQDIDESKFDLMIHGDIHTKQEIGKFISVGNPIPIDFNSLCDDADVLIFDTATLKWERVLTDPDHTRFLRMHYTKNKDEEGFHGPLEYRVYKPELTIESGETKEKTITWNSIDSLIKSVCDSKDLLDIHGEVESKCIPYSEIDFNFQLKKFHVHGYRSLVDISIEFEKGDRIVLLGDNGSGKSSIIESLRGVFDKNSYLKYEQSDLCDDQLIELSLVYQNKLYEITKGNLCRLVIDGIEQQYSSKTEFESDLKVKLPFLNYLDLIFITSNIQNLSNQFTSNRRIELISKFYRLDRITAYWKTALNLYSEIESELETKKSERDVQIGILNHTISRLTELEEVKDLDLNQLESERLGYQKLRDDSSIYKNWLAQKSKMTELVRESDEKLEKLNLELASSDDLCRETITELEKTREELSKSLVDTSAKYTEFLSKLAELTSVEESGSKLSTELESINKGTCPFCGAKLSESKNKDLVTEITAKLVDLRSKWAELDDYMITQPQGRDSKRLYSLNLAKMNDSLAKLNSKIQVMRNRIELFSSVKDKKAAETEINSRYKSELESIVKSEPVKVILPINLSESEAKVIAKIGKCKEYKKEFEDKVRLSNIVSDLDDEIKTISTKLDRYNEYISIMSIEGDIYEKILTQLASKFSSTDIIYEVESGIYRNKKYLQFNSSYLSKGKYRCYESLSTGQKTLCDIDFLDKLFSTQVGLLVLDESLAHLDDKNSPRIYEILRSMNVNILLIASHDSNISMYTKRLLLYLDETGKTVIESD